MRTVDGAASCAKSACGTSREETDSAGADEQPKNDQDDPEHELSTDRRDDAGDDENDGEYPQHRGHEASKMFRDRNAAIAIDLSTSSGDCAHPSG